MNLNFKELIPEDFHISSRVWIYQSNRLFTLHEALQIEDLLKDFTETWNSHGVPVKGYGNLFFGQFVVLMADESASGGVSGCSIDSTVRIIRDMEQIFQVSLFDRQLLSFIVKERVQMIPLPQLNYALENNFIDGDTPYFNNTVQNLDELLNNWLIPVKDSWLGSRYAIPSR